MWFRYSERWSTKHFELIIDHGNRVCAKKPVTNALIAARSRLYQRFCIYESAIEDGLIKRDSFGRLRPSRRKVRPDIAIADLFRRMFVVTNNTPMRLEELKLAGIAEFGELPQIDEIISEALRNGDEFVEIKRNFFQFTPLYLSVDNEPEPLDIEELEKQIAMERFVAEDAHAEQSAPRLSSTGIRDVIRTFLAAQTGVGFLGDITAAVIAAGLQSTQPRSVVRYHLLRMSDVRRRGEIEFELVDREPAKPRERDPDEHVDLIIFKTIQRHGGLASRADLQDALEVQGHPLTSEALLRRLSAMPNVAQLDHDRFRIVHADDPLKRSPARSPGNPKAIQRGIKIRSIISGSLGRTDIVTVDDIAADLASHGFHYKAPRISIENQLRKMSGVVNLGCGRWTATQKREPNPTGSSAVATPVSEQPPSVPIDVLSIRALVTNHIKERRSPKLAEIIRVVTDREPRLSAENVIAMLKRWPEFKFRKA